MRWQRSNSEAVDIDAYLRSIFRRPERGRNVGSSQSDSGRLGRNLISWCFRCPDLDGHAVRDDAG